MRIRSHLVVLVLLSILPVVAFSAIMTAVFWRQQRASIERGFLEGVRAMAIALDREHAGTVRSLRVLSHSAHLESGDLRAFEAQARRILAQEPTWANLILAEPTGQELLDLRRSVGDPLPTVGDDASLKQLVATLEPVFSNLLRMPDTGRYVTSVGVPVVHGRRFKYALFAIIDQATWLNLIGTLPMPHAATMTLLDRNHVIIARTLNPDQWVGKLPSPGFLERARQAPEGAYRSIGLEGQRFYTAHHRTRTSGWTIASGVPTEYLEAGLWKTTLLLTGGATLALALVIGLALAFGRRIARPVAALADQAGVLGRGQRLPADRLDSGIAEVDHVAAALETAGGMIRERDVERATLLERERAARAEAEAASRAKDEFLAVLSHELRTPINAVYGWARMLQRGQVDPGELPRAIDVIVRNSNAQVQLIDDLLDVSRIVTGKLRLEVRRIDRAAVVEAALDAVRPAADAKAIALERAIEDEAGSVMGDPARLQQVIWNLLINSVKFTPRGGRVRVTLRWMGAHAEIVVTDSGEGIDAETLPFVFERFRQGDAGSTRTHGGLGVGLALVRHLVELHGGTVTAASEGAGKGATFTVRLPVSEAPGEDEMASPASSPSAPAARPVLDGTRVLVVDGDRSSRERASTILSAAGAEVRTSTSAAEAFEVFGLWRPDVLLCDVETPAEGSTVLIERLRRLDRSQGGRTPAVGVTANGRPEDRVRTLSAGFNMHLPKPVDPAELVTVVASLTGS